MTNKPEVKRYEPESGYDSVMRKVNWMQESESGGYVRFDDYEALQAAHEEELFCVRQTRDSHFGEMMRALEQVDAMKAEREKLRNLLRHAQPIIRAHAGASHMLDGFRPKRNQWDELVERIDAAIQEENRVR